MCGRLLFLHVRRISDRWCNLCSSSTCKITFCSFYFLFWPFQQNRCVKQCSLHILGSTVTKADRIRKKDLSWKTTWWRSKNRNVVDKLLLPVLAFSAQTVGLNSAASSTSRAPAARRTIRKQLFFWRRVSWGMSRSWQVSISSPLV